MPVLTKINTNSIAEDAITGDKFAGDAYLANTANQNISGTYSENRLYTSDAYTLSGNATVNSHLTLSSIKPTAPAAISVAPRASVGIFAEVTASSAIELVFIFVSTGIFPYDFVFFSVSSSGFFMSDYSGFCSA